MDLKFYLFKFRIHLALPNHGHGAVAENVLVPVVVAGVAPVVEDVLEGDHRIRLDDRKAEVKADPGRVVKAGLQQNHVPGHDLDLKKILLADHDLNRLKKT